MHPASNPYKPLIYLDSKQNDIEMTSVTAGEIPKEKKGQKVQKNSNVKVKNDAPQVEKTVVTGENEVAKNKELDKTAKKTKAKKAKKAADEETGKKVKKTVNKAKTAKADKVTGEKVKKKAEEEGQPTQTQAQSKNGVVLSAEQRMQIRPNGCSTCRKRPGCTNSCWSKRNV